MKLDTVLKRLALPYFFLGLFISSVHAEPWFTGPLLAPSGHNIPKGHSNLETYALRIHADGLYNALGQEIQSPLYQTTVINPIFSHGYTDWLDLMLNVPYVINTTRDVHYERLADVAVGAGFQLYEQKGKRDRIDARIFLQEVIPTGRFDHLNPRLLGTDSTGLGSYQTQLSLNLQYLMELFPSHYLRTRLVLSHLRFSSVDLHGLSSYGGSAGTQGRIQPGHENDVDLAFEYTLTQHWVAVMEGYVSQGSESLFNGIFNIEGIGGPKDNVGFDRYSEKALAPAIEYNFNENVGIIGGVWFPVAGTNTGHYTTYLLALNIFW
jgi:hypothetical protein